MLMPCSKLTLALVALVCTHTAMAVDFSTELSRVAAAKQQPGSTLATEKEIDRLTRAFPVETDWLNHATPRPQLDNKGRSKALSAYLGAAGNHDIIKTAVLSVADEQEALTDPGWVSLGEKDFAQVNCDPDTFQFGKEPGTLHCTGKPHGGLRSQKIYRDFEIEFEWRHNQYAGNAGIFLWCPRKVLDELPRGKLPQGIEVQILDLGYEERWLKGKGKHSAWFTSHGDIFPVGIGQMRAANPQMTYTEDGATWTVGNPNSKRSFPTKRLTRPHGQWNHYHIRAVDGTVTLRVNGEEVTRAYDCQPREGHLVMESEGAPIDFRGMRLRELPEKKKKKKK